MRISPQLVIVAAFLAAFLVPAISHDAAGQTVSPPISINGDPDLATQATTNSWVGSGLPGDPYIIEDLLISANTDHGIAVRNTTSHLLIRNCVISGSSSFHGIVIDNVSNAVVSGNTVSDHLIGIAAQWSTGNEFHNNTAANSTIGISLAVAGSSVVENNSVRNSSAGISFYFASLSRAANNSID